MRTDSPSLSKPDVTVRPPARPSGCQYLWLALLIAVQPLRGAHADPEGDSQRLSACVAAHFTAADSTVMAQMTALLIVDAQATGDDIQTTFDSKRGEIFAAVAAVVARYAEQDCPTEVHAAAASLPTGDSFKIMFQTLGQLAGRAMAPAMNRISMAIGLELIKSMDSKVTLDLFGPSAAPPPKATTPQSTPGSPTPGTSQAPGGNH